MTPGTHPFQRDVGPVDSKTLRVTLAGAGLGLGPTPFGLETDLPAAAPADATAATMIALLKAILNKNFEIRGDTVNIDMNTDDLEARIGDDDGNIIAALPTTDPASLNALLRGIWVTLKASGGSPITATNTYEIQTNVAGATFNTLPSNLAKEFRINNDTGTDLEIQKAGGADPEFIPDGASVPFFCLVNINEWEVRRVDTSNTQVIATGSFIER